MLEMVEGKIRQEMNFQGFKNARNLLQAIFLDSNSHEKNGSRPVSLLLDSRLFFYIIRIGETVHYDKIVVSAMREAVDAYEMRFEMVRRVLDILKFSACIPRCHATKKIS